VYKRIYFIALVPSLKFGVKHHTLYLFNKEEQVVLPIEIKNMEAIMFLTGKVGVVGNTPHLYMFIKALLDFFGAKLVSVTILDCEYNLFCAELNLVVNEKHVKMSIDFTDAFVISRLFDAPLYADHKVLDEHGIKVSKEILRDALRD